MAPSCVDKLPEGMGMKKLITLSELATQEIWNSLLAMKIFERFGLWRSIALHLP